MKIVGVVAEFNPFHNGHAHLLQRIRAEEGAETLIICAMSGNWMQRGEPAIVSKFPRAEIAVRCGADIMIELPTPWAVSSAGNFAAGAVKLLANAGVELLYFGSESGDISEMEAVAQCIESEACQNEIVEQLKKGVSYPSARASAVQQLLGARARCLDYPNNNLGVEYILAKNKLASHMEVKTVSRHAVHHDALTPEFGFASASYVRSCLIDGAWDEVEMFVPAAAVEVLAQEEQFGRLPADFTMSEQMVLSRLRCMSAADFAAMQDVSEGLENRLYKAARQACCMEEFLDLCKTKRFTHARLRRILIHTLLETARFDLPEEPNYLRVLAASVRGQKQLRSLARKEDTLPIISRATQIKKCSDEVKALFAFEERCTDLYALCYPDSAQWVGGSEYRAKPYFSE